MRQLIRNTLTVVLLVTALTSAVPPSTAKVQDNSTSQTNAVSPANITDALAPLPASEAVMYFDVQRALNEGLPRAFGNSHTRLADINCDIENFKTRTGLDAREFDVVAVFLKFTPRLKSLFPPRGTLQINPVVIARGRFDADRIVAITTRTRAQHVARSA